MSGGASKSVYVQGPFNTQRRLITLNHSANIFSDLSTAHLKYLSSRQALEDMAAFIRAMNTKFSIQTAKWITFGGSYSGFLSPFVKILSHICMSTRSKYTTLVKLILLHSCTEPKFSGALSAWMREKYPDLVSGAVATSGPVQAEVDFVGKLQFNFSF